jgi:hypothetical protein
VGLEADGHDKEGASIPSECPKLMDPHISSGQKNTSFIPGIKEGLSTGIDRGFPSSGTTSKYILVCLDK